MNSACPWFPVDSKIRSVSNAGCERRMLPWGIFWLPMTTRDVVNRFEESFQQQEHSVRAAKDVDSALQEIAMQHFDLIV